MHKVKSTVPLLPRPQTKEEWLARVHAAQQRSDETRKRCEVIEQLFK